MDEEQLKQIASQLRKPEGEAGIKTGEWMNVGNLQMNKDVLKVLASANKENIFEVGMGNGLFVKEILKNKPLTTYTGCDFSHEMVEEAKKINAPWITREQARFIKANANSLPLGNALFDKIFTVNTVYFWDNESLVFGELRRVLKPNGILILGLRPKHQMLKYPFSKYGFKMFSKEDITNLVESNGFKIKEVFENREPDFDLNEELMKMENMIVVASKR